MKRKGSPSLEEDAESSKRRFAEEEVATETGDDTTQPPPAESEPVAPAQTEDAEDASTTTMSTDRAARFAALRARNQASRKENLKETKNEAKRASTDPTQLTALNRKRDIAQHKLLKAEVEESGEDFERKRAWDWTVEESERWDKKLAKKERARDSNAFQDYSTEAGKIYKRQIDMMEKAGWDDRKEAYEREKASSLDRAIQNGGLELVETPTGELIAVDKDGTFYSTADSTSHITNKPDRAAVDRLVADIKKAEEVRLKKRRERGKDDGEGERDVTFINEKNKQFNMKLARFYNKYTADIRESFERGTAI
ncbi:Pre-mRNA-splicing factor SYF2 [Recurvomyces mirabilis]|uniref:Pre-mRNA-splicing factor SYF2 n=1 Tax=Recurvomyces mirabilis TaxID=574656 RepID=A0AAE0WSM1_9PEZI|nr:Pre-mRNA-splicing factor SYF2 [Recurvomyces mirabilis]KAK5156894.1 Pre-mRNA-splicing factor SYF2 [Recurvomyces mirabilis]